MVRQMFDAADTNSDQVLVLDEFKQFVLFMIEALSSFSTNGLDEDIKLLFERFDAD